VAERPVAVLRWWTNDLQRVGGLLATLGAEVDGDATREGERWLFANAVLVLTRSTDRRDTGRLELGSGPGEDSPAGAAEARPVLVAIGWATVDMDRAAGDIGGTPSDVPEPLPPDELLGAFSRRIRIGSDPPIVLLEPSTEGRLAARLARHGEGPAALYLGAGGDQDLAQAIRVAGGMTSSPADGPFGSSVLIAGGTAWEPQLVLVTAADAAGSQAATIGR